MDPGIRPSTLALVPLLLAASAFFIAAEFSLFTLRRSRLEQQARDGDASSARLLRMLGRLDELVLTAQLGSSMATLGLGAVLAILSLHLAARPVLALAWFGGWQPALPSLLAAGLIIALVVVLHVVLATQVPKVIGSQRAELIATRLSVLPLWLLSLPLRPLLWLLKAAVEAVSRAAGVAADELHPLVHTPQEIRDLVAQSHESGVVEEDERQMIHGVFEFSDTVAREVMTPRTNMVALPAETGLDELLRVVVEEGHSRIPVYEGSLDNITGVLLAKDLLPYLWNGNGAGEQPFSLRRIMREPYFVPETKPVDDILAEFRQQSVHLAIVLDEFGGTYGLLTMEDLLEEIVGEITDEYDVAEPEAFSVSPEGHTLVDGAAAISHVNEHLEIELPEDDFDTVGGYVFGALGRVPVVGDAVEVVSGSEQIRLEVEAVDERRVSLLRLSRRETVDEAADETDAGEASAEP